MNVTFVCLGNENLGVEYLSAVLKENGHKTRLVFHPRLFDTTSYIPIKFLKERFDVTDDIVDRVRETNPDLVAFSVTTPHYLKACEIAREVKRRFSIPVIFGGIHVTSVPDRVIENDFIDIVCVGEGENALLALANSMQKGNIDYSIPNLWFKRDGKVIQNPIGPIVDDLDSLPFPDKELFEDELSLSDYYMLSTSRGCPYNCTYCCNSVNKGVYSNKFLRRESVDRVIDQLRTRKRLYNFKRVYFVDDVFTMDPEYVRDFTCKYKQEIGVPFECVTHPNFFNMDVARWIKESGCYVINFGLQSIVDETRKNIINRYETKEKIEEVLKICEKVGLGYRLDIIFGFPTEGIGAQEIAAEFFATTRPVRISAFWFVYFPRTPIIDIAKRRSLITEDEIDKIERGYLGTYLTAASNSTVEDVMFKNFKKLYILMPAFPRFFNRFIVKRRLYMLLRFIPYKLFFFIEMLISIKNRHVQGLIEMKYYLKQIRKHLARRVRIA